MPTECRFTVFLPQKVQTYRACCVISIFLTCFRSEAPYLHCLSQQHSITIERASTHSLKARICWYWFRSPGAIFTGHTDLYSAKSATMRWKHLPAMGDLLFVRFVILNMKDDAAGNFGLVRLNGGFSTLRLKLCPQSALGTDWSWHKEGSADPILPRSPSAHFSLGVISTFSHSADR
jgi:hypothetical protein